MKKQFKTLIVIAVIGVLCIAAAACSSGGDNAAVGKWDLKSVDLMGQSLTAEELAAANPDLANTSVEFKADGTYSLTSGGNTDSGGYKIEENTITLSESGITMTGEITGDTLLLDLSEIAGVDFIATFTKA